MKIALIFLLLVANLVVFGQSTKKQNKTLKRDLEECKEKSLPVLVLYKEKKDLIDSIRGEAMQRNYKVIQAELPGKELYLKTVQLIKDLKLLGVDLKTVIDVDSIAPFPDYKGFTKDMDDLLNWEDRGVGILSGTPYLKGLEMEEQNKILKNLVFECNSYFNSLNDRLNKIEPDQKRLQAVIPKLDSMILLYQSLTPDLRLRKMTLEHKLHELRENYRQKGPNGFPEAYKIVFPDLFSPDEGPVYVDTKELKPEPASPKMDVYTIVDEDAQFPGGMPALKKYLVESIHYPEIAAELGVEPNHVVRFVVRKEGSISDIKLKKPMTDCPECDKEVIRVVKSMPKWIPGKVNGKAVDSWYTLPVHIHLK